MSLLARHRDAIRRGGSVGRAATHHSATGAHHPVAGALRAARGVAPATHTATAAAPLLKITDSAFRRCDSLLLEAVAHVVPVRLAKSLKCGPCLPTCRTGDVATGPRLRVLLTLSTKRLHVPKCLRVLRHRDARTAAPPVASSDQSSHHVRFSPQTRRSFPLLRPAGSPSGVSSPSHFLSWFRSDSPSTSQGQDPCVPGREDSGARTP